MQDGWLFPSPQVWNPNTESWAVAAGDLDGDGDVDVVQSSSSAELFIHLNRGNGTFDPPSHPRIRPYEENPELADVNGDQILDLVTVGPNNVAIRLGDGSGLFGDPTTYPTRSNPLDWAFQDVNGDGTRDAIVGLFTGGGVEIFLGDGQGGLLDPIFYDLGDAVFAVDVHDMDDDGRPEIIASLNRPDQIVVLRNFGFGLFEECGAVASNRLGLRSIAAGDIDGDGIPDVVAGSEAGEVVVYRGDGACGLVEAGVYPAASLVNDLALLDLDDDGDLDVMAAQPNAYDTRVFLNDGSGSLESSMDYPSSWRPSGVTSADIDADGRPDILAAGWNITILFNEGAGDFASGTVYDPVPNPTAAASLDANLDGLTDIVVAETDPNGVSVWLNDSRSTLAESGTFSTGGSPAAMTSANLDDANGLDLVVCNFGGSIGVLLSEGDGSFADATLIDGLASSRSPCIEDVTGDGLADLIVADPDAGLIRLFIGDGAGGLASLASYSVSQRPWDVVLADLDGDLDVDFASIGEFDGQVVLYQNDGAGDFALAGSFAVSRRHTDMAMGDIDGDGDNDLVLAGGDAQVYLNDGTGIFEFSQGLVDPGMGDPRKPMLTDADQDGDLDLLAINPFTAYALVWRNDGTGLFAERAECHATPQDPAAAITADVLGTCGPELIVASTQRDRFVVLDNLAECIPACQADFNDDGDVNTQDFIAYLGAWSAGDLRADINSDGAVDTLDFLDFLALWAAGCP